VVLAAELADATGYGRIVRNPEGNVEAIVEQKDTTEEQRRIHLVNTGMLVADAAPLKRWLGALRNDNAQGEYYLTDVFALAAAEFEPADIVLIADPEECEGANDAWQLSQLERAFQRRAVRALCVEGVRFADPERVDIRGNRPRGPRCRNRRRRDPRGRHRARRQRPHRAVLPAEGRLPRRRNAGARALRPGRREQRGGRADRAVRTIASGHRAGRRRAHRNFVETKNARLGPGSKVNHLSYLGDAQIGNKVNVGAGTITCNYDGVNKSTTTIGDGAFIGSKPRSSRRWSLERTRRSAPAR
jgi:bifunctional UDP-N-acetylglucosamine pyrophosphorylase/glucosamine-1-phosphate N-acetyltransferase